MRHTPFTAYNTVSMKTIFFILFSSLVVITILETSDAQEKTVIPSVVI